MKKFVASALVAALLVPTQALARPEQMPAKGVEFFRSDRCGVRDAVNSWRFVNCTVLLVTKRDRDGNIVRMNYTDHGQLTDDQVKPDRAITLEFDSPDPACVGTETITPGGQYTSNIRCSY